MISAELGADGVLELVVNRPPVNAFTIGLLHDLSALLEGVAERPDVRVVILRAEGRGFCGGGDVKEVEQLPGFEGILGQTSGSQRLSLAILHCAVPVICAVHGYCVGVGVLAAASADILVAARGVRFILSEIDNGATSGAVQALRILPEKRVRAAMMTAEPILAEELHRFGSVYRLVETDEDVVAAGREIAATVAGKNPEAMRKLKRSINHTTKAAEVEALYRAEMSFTYELNIKGIASEGRQAFVEGQRKSYLR